MKLKCLILLIMVLWLVSSSSAAVWEETEKVDFEAGTPSQIDTTESPGDVLIGIDSLPEPAESTREERFFADGSEAVGVLACDGTYLYGKSWATYDGSDYTITKIGSGYNGTTAGTIYGDIVNAGYSMSMTYHSDGYLYNGRTTTGSNLQRIHPGTGTIDYVDLASPLMARDTGNDLSGGYDALLITSDGTYIYNLAYHRAGMGGGTYNGFTIKVFDPSNNWLLVRKITSGTSSFYMDGVFADGKYVYPIEWGGSRRIRRIDATTGAEHDEWTSDQTSTDVINGQYDWVNNKVWLGALRNSGICKYPGKTYFESGYLESSNHDTGNPGGTTFQTIWWNGEYGVEQGTTLKFRIKTADTEAKLTGAVWVGSDGTSSTYYETSYSGITTDPGASGTTWIQYKAYFDTTNVVYTPSLEDISISYYPADNDPPSAFSLTSPASGDEVSTLTPTFIWGESIDPNGDAVTYTLWYDTNDSFTTKVEITGITLETYTAASNLSDNTKYYWKVKAVDGHGAETWSTQTNWYFFVNLGNESPSSPTVKSPPDGSTTVTDLTPELIVYNATDPDPNDTLTYEFEVYDNSEYSGSPVASAAGIAEGVSETAWEVSTALVYFTTYYWQARANDGQVSGPWAKASFTMNNGWTQTDWSGGDGQEVWSSADKYFSGSTIDNSTQGQITIEIESNPEPKSPCELTFSAENSEAVGVLACDGKYLYGKSWLTYDGNDRVVTMIGTGLNGTTQGVDYGDVATVTGSLAMTYHSDGYLYNGVATGGGYDLERIDISTGVLDTVNVPDGLINRTNAVVQNSQQAMITSDGTYIYNLAYHRAGEGGGTYNGFTIKVFDPSDNWALVRKITSGTSSFYADGVFADGKYVYPIEWTNTNNARIRRIDAVSGANEGEWTINQGTTKVINGQYDWVNNKVWLGDLFGPDIYRYSGRKYHTGAELISSKFDAGAETNFSQITWNADVPTDTYVKFQIRTAENSSLLDSFPWFGPDGTELSYYEAPGTEIPTVHDEDRWIQYKLFLSTDNEACTPTLEDVTITMYPTWEHPPDPFDLLSPAEGQAIAALSVTLDWEDATDPDVGDYVTYTLWYSETPNFTTKTEITKISESTYALSGLSEDTCYYWKVKAVDKYGAETWSNQTDWYFSCNADNNVPSQPTLKSPSDGSTVAALNPFLEIYNSVDADPYDTLTYEFAVYKNASLSILVTSESGVTEGSSGTTSWTVTPSLAFNQTYYWRARATDGFSYGNWMDTASFAITSSGEWSQTDWSGGDGQAIWSTTDKYLGADKADDTAEGYLALEVATSPEPKASTRELTFAAENSEAVGVLACDGKYLYGKSWATYDGNDRIVAKIGTGYNGTTRGVDYGDVATVSYSLAMTYHSDDYLYNGVATGAGYDLQRINISTGALDTVNVPDGLMNRSNAVVQNTQQAMITSDGRYIYNVAYHRTDIGGGTYNGFTIKIFDPSNNWSLVRKITSGTSSFYMDGVFADGKYVYPIEWGGSRRIRRIDAITGANSGEWTSDQVSTSVINGQYDWINNKVWLGDLFGPDIYMYSGKVYYGSGELTSSAYDTGGLSSFDTITWDADVPGSSSIKFQLRTASDDDGSPGDWTDWLGPTDTGDYYTTSGSTINSSLIGNQWLQYKAYLTSGSTPTLNSITISYKVDEHEPNPFHLTSPEKGAVLYTSSPTLDWDDATDPDGDAITYTLWYSTNPDFVTKTEVTGISESNCTISNLSEDTCYYWKVKAVDVYGKYRWCIETDWYFACNATNLAPSAPTLHSPANGSSIETLNPDLEVNNSSDGDPYDTLTYEFEVYTNSALTNQVASVSGVDEGDEGITSWTAIPPLTFGQTYYWRARANDGTATSEWMDTARFTITVVGRWTQTDWSGGDGQSIWYDTTRYLNADDMDGASKAGRLLLGKMEGEGGEKQPVEGFSSISSYVNEDVSYPDYRGESYSWWAYDGEFIEWAASVPSSYTHGKLTLIWTATWHGDGTNTITVNGSPIFSDCSNPLDSDATYTSGDFTWHYDYKGYDNGYNGVCYLTVPVSYAPADSSVSIGLTHSGSGWYMIKARDDTLSYEESAGALVTDTVGTGGIYCGEGKIFSSKYNTGSMSEFTTISWTDTTADGASLKFQLRAAPDENGTPGEWTKWLGPISSSDYYTISGSDINSNLTGNQWVQYRAYFTKGSSPQLEDITVRYNIDDDQIGPAIYNFSPDHANAGTPFHVTCYITDPSGVYDDSTGSDGQGVYLVWADNPGISGGQEIQMSSLSTDTNGNGSYITDSPIPAQTKGTIVYYRVSAYDNDCDGGATEDRTQTISSVQSVVIGNKFIEIGVDSPQVAGVPFAVSLIARIDMGDAISTDTSYSGTAETGVVYTSPSTGTKVITPKTVNFDAGVATVELVYPDCGTIKITVTDTDDTTITGVSDEVLFKPDHLRLTLPESPIVVSEPFDLKISAYNANGEITPNYSESVKVSILYLDPQDGDGTITPEEVDSFSSGVATASATYTRCGEISIRAVDDNTEGILVETESEGIRFIPQRFKLEISSIPIKRDFFYIGEVFRITAMAVDYENATIPNYSGTIRFDRVSGIILPQDYTYTESDSGKHIFPISVDEAKDGLTLNVRDIDYSEVSGSIMIPSVKYGAVRVLSTSGRVGSLEVEVQVEDASGNVIEEDYSTTFTVILLEEDNPNGSATSEASGATAQAITISAGRAVITVTNNEPEVVTVSADSTPYLYPISGKITFGGIGSDGIRIIHWEEEK